MPRHQASHTLDAKLLRDLDQLADQAGESRSEIVNQLLQEALARRERARFVQTASQAGVGTACLVALVHLAQLLLLAA